MSTLHKLLMLLVMLTWINGYAQVEEDIQKDPEKEEEPRENKRDLPPVIEKIPDVAPSFRGGFKLPTILRNVSFRKALEGVANFEFSGQYPVYKGLLLGGGVNSCYYDINFNALPELTKGSFLSYGGFGLVGWEKYMTPRIYFHVHEKIGYQYFRLKTANCPNGEHTGSSFFIETQAGIYMWGSSERMSYGLLVGYQTSMFAFGPSYVCRNSFSGLVQSDYEGNGGIINVGFGFSIMLGKL